MFDRLGSLLNSGNIMCSPAKGGGLKFSVYKERWCLITRKKLIVNVNSETVSICESVYIRAGV